MRHTVAVLLLLLASVPASAAAIEPYETVLVGRQSTSDGGAPADADTFPNDLTRGAGLVAFLSEARNLSPDVPNQFREYPLTMGFVYDVGAQAITVPARASDSAGGAVADGDSGISALSSDGRFAVFGSIADNVSPDDEDKTHDVFLRDRRTGTTSLVSRRSGADGAAAESAEEEAGSTSGARDVSDDGRFVVFRSDADNLSDRDRNGDQNLFVRDMRKHRTELVSPARRRGPDTQFVDGGSISADGRRVAFLAIQNNATDPSGHNDRIRVLVRDRAAGRTIVVHARGSGDSDALDGRYAWAPDISGSGRYVTYVAIARADFGRYLAVFRHDLRTGRRVLVSPGSRFRGRNLEPSIDHSGRFVAFAFVAAPPVKPFEPVSQVWLHDVAKRRWHRVDRASGKDGAGADGTAAYPAVSPDGRHVAFPSTARNLAPETTQTVNAYVRRVLP